MSSTESGDMQLLEISRRARKLAQMINSLFRVQNFDGRNKRIPGGLLLEDALSMTADAKEKKLEMGRKLGAEEGEQFGSCCHEEEVKKVIRERLLLSSREDEKASSSRSLGSYIRSGEFGSSFRKEEEEEEAIKIKNLAKNSRRPQGKNKMATPNLIARLMGLEELPAREAATAAAKIKPERESPSVSRDGAPQRVTLLSIIEREKAAKHDGSGFSDAKFCAKAMQIPTWGPEEEEQEPLNSSRLKKNKKIEHQRFRKVTEAPLPMNYSVRSLAVLKDSASPGKRATGVKPAQKFAKLKTSIEKAEGRSKGEDDAPVMDISSAQYNQHSSRSSNNEQEHSHKHPKTDCEIRPKPSQFGARRCPSDSIDDRLDNNADKRVAGEAKHLDNSLLDACQLSSIYEATSTNNSDADANFYLACARELLLRRRRYQELRVHRPRLSTGSSSSARVLSTHDLPGEICKGIREYSVVIGHGHGYGSERDGLYVKLERDLECKDAALNAVWDDGWRDGLGWEVVGLLEEMVVTELMEEMVVVTGFINK